MAENNAFKPKLVGFLCNWCSYAGSDLAGTSRIHHDISVRAIRVMCSGRVEPAFVIKAFAEGADGVIIAGCHIPADCHYTNGNFKALARYEAFLPLLDELGIERERLQLHWISASEGEKFARVMNEFSATIKNLGPLKLDKSKICKLEDAALCGECAVIRKSQEFAACEAASSGMIDLEQRKTYDMPKRVMEPSIIFDPVKCVRCGSCVESCSLQEIGAITMDENDGVVIDDTKCVRCGQCVLSCPLSFPDKTISHVRDMLECGMCAYGRPVGAVTEKDDTALVADAIKNKEKYLVVQFAPSVRTTIGEEFGAEPGELMIKKLYTAFRQMGFDKVSDTNFTADLTIMEEGTEFLGRLQNGGVSPMFTSCCPAWVKFIETYYPVLTPNLSTAKSPQQMLGAAAKTALAKQLGIDPAKIFVVSVMPCTAKKYERARDEMSSASHYWAENGKDGGSYPDVDVVLTTRECIKLLKLYGIDLSALPGSEPDEFLSEYTGAGTIFGRTGGVMTAALRSAYELATGKELGDIDLVDLGTMEGIKTASVDVNGAAIKVAVTSGLQNARKICEDVLSGGEFSKYNFIEIMSCPGGCVGGGGQTITTNKQKVAERTLGLNSEDKNLSIRKSHENASVAKLYKDFYEKPCSELSHKLLHTHYHGK